MDAQHPSWNTLVGIEASLPRLQHCPMLLCWGGQDFCFNDTFFEEWQRRFPEAEAHYFPEAGHYVLEDGLVDILSLIEGFLARAID
jgi:haloalkane dehalogenase